MDITQRVAGRFVSVRKATDESKREQEAKAKELEQAGDVEEVVEAADDEVDQEIETGIGDVVDNLEGAITSVNAAVEAIQKALPLLQTFRALGATKVDTVLEDVAKGLARWQAVVQALTEVVATLRAEEERIKADFDKFWAWIEAQPTDENGYLVEWLDRRKAPPVHNAKPILGPVIGRLTKIIRATETWASNARWSERGSWAEILEWITIPDFPVLDELDALKDSLDDLDDLESTLDTAQDALKDTLEYIADKRTEFLDHFCE